jgi:hypothetical protein
MYRRERVWGNDQTSARFAREFCHDRFNFFWFQNRRCDALHSVFLRCLLYEARNSETVGPPLRIEYERDAANAWCNVLEQVQPFPSY